MRSQLVVLFPLIFAALSSGLQLKSNFALLFDDDLRPKLQQIYEVIPGSLAKFLEEKDIVKPIRFHAAFVAEDISMGADKKVVMHRFDTHLRKSIEGEFRLQKITEIRPEDLSMEITQLYENKLVNRPDPGQRNWNKFQFEKQFTGKEGGSHRTGVYAYVFIEIEEMCENNWIFENQRRFSYDLRIEMHGISINEKKASILRELIIQDGVPAAIDHIKKDSKITWSDLEDK